MYLEEMLIWGGIMSKNVTYQQYRDAAYRYNSASEKMRKEKQELEEANESLCKKREELEQIEVKITDNRTQRTDLLERETKIFKQQWEVKKVETDKEVDDEIRKINEEAGLRLDKQNEDYNKKKAGIDKIVRPYYNRVEIFKTEVQELSRKESNLGDFTKEVPIGNKKVQDFLNRSRKKRFLSRKQDELLRKPCDVIIEKNRNFRVFDDVINAEKELAASDWYKRLEKGDVTERVRMKAASSRLSYTFLRSDCRENPHK